MLLLRDVFEVDGKPVRDAVGRARALAEEGARYNLWIIGTVNNPLLAMAFLQPNYRPRFRFNLAGIDKSLGGRGDGSRGEDAVADGIRAPGMASCRASPPTASSAASR
jgi:hypothetical protein